MGTLDAWQDWPGRGTFIVMAQPTAQKIELRHGIEKGGASLSMLNWEWGEASANYFGIGFRNLEITV